MAENIVESIIVKLGLDGSQYNREADKAIGKNDKLNKSVGDTDKAVGAVTKTLAKWFSVLAVATGVTKMIDEVQKLNDELFFLEKNLGMSSQSIKNWQGAAGAMGGSAQGMTESIKSLNMGMNDFVTMGDTSLLPFMNAIGVSMVDTQGKLRKTDDVMLDLADSFSKMDREQAFSIASKMGIDEGTFNTLVQGRKEMEKMLEYQSKMYKSSEEELKASRQLAQNRALLGQHWESLKTMMANAIIPLFVKLSEIALGIFEFLQENKQAVQAVFKGIAFVVGAVLIPILAKATLAALAFIAPFAPFILVVGALGAAFGLLYEDYKIWAEGGKSLFDWGAFRKYIDDSTLSTDNLAKSFKNLVKELISGAIPTLQGYANIVRALLSGDFKGAAGMAWGMIKQFGTNVANVVDDLTGQAQGTLSNAVGGLFGGGSASSTESSPAQVGGGLQAKGGTSDKAKFVEKYLPVAQQVGSQLGVPPEALLGQWALETGWGRSITKGTGFNLGNIKAGSSWKGKTVRAYDKAEKSNDEYRVYNTPEEFASDYVKLIKGRKGYKNAIGAKTAEEYFSGLKAGGYATDPLYVKSGVSVTNSVLKELKPATAQDAMRQSDATAVTKAQAQAGQQKSTAGNKTDVNIGEVKIQTSSSTMTGTGQDLAKGVQDQFYQFQLAIK